MQLFNHGNNIVQILDQKDPNWWQAKKVGDNELPGLIPSQELEERRKAFVAPEADYVHKTSICGTRVILINWMFLHDSMK